MHTFYSILIDVVELSKPGSLKISLNKLSNKQEHFIEMLLFIHRFDINMRYQNVLVRRVKKSLT